MTLAVTGDRSAIVSELKKLLPSEEEVVWIDDMGDPPVSDRYLLCAGLLRPKTLRQQAIPEITESLFVNCIWPMHICDAVLERNDKARIVVMGSESGIRWSFDGAYAASKAALHKYVETKKLKPDQQLVCVAPSTIEDCGMTTRRQDVDNLKKKLDAHPKRRFLRAAEVARFVHYLLYIDEGYLSGTVIKMDGGVK